MSYNYTKAADLARWCEEQYNKSTKYELGGIGRYRNGVRIFDCIGLIKCFLWFDYSSSNAKYYGVTAPDWDANGYFNSAKEKGPISTIPEEKGIIVFQNDHVGVYVGNGVVIEATASWNNKVQKSYFKGNHSGLYKRTSWTHWFKLPQLSYDKDTSVPIKVGDNVQVLKAIQFDNGKPFTMYYDTYKVMEVFGDRICIGAGGVITAAVHKKNLKKV